MLYAAEKLRLHEKSPLTGVRMTDKSTIPLAITAEQVGIKAVTLRRWCEYHAAYLSPGANPPTGQARRFNGRDIEVLKTVRELREEGFSVARINEKLSGLTFAEIDTSAADSADSEELAPTTFGRAQVEAAPDGLQQAPQSIVVALQHIERRMDAYERRRFDTVTAIGLGFTAGLLFCAILIGLAWLYGGTY